MRNSVPLSLWCSRKNTCRCCSGAEFMFSLLNTSEADCVWDGSCVTPEMEDMDVFMES
jgi:hypothetical protein